MPRPYPKHKGNGLPSRSFLYGAFRRHLDQRFSLEFVVKESWKGLMIEMGFDLSKPIYFNGIFRGFWKKPSRRGESGPLIILLRFAGCTWRQDDKVLTDAFSKPSRHAKRGEWQFEVSDFKGLKWQLGDVPLLEYSGDRRS